MMKDFFTINLGQVIMFIGWIIAAIWAVAQISSGVKILTEQVSRLQKEIDLIYKKFEVQDKKLSFLDVEGGHFIQSFIKQMSESQVNTSQRLAKMEDYIPKLAVMGNNIEWIRDKVSDLPCYNGNYLKAVKRSDSTNTDCPEIKTS